MITETFCNVQFKKMLFASIATMLMMTIAGMIDMILAARFFGDKAMAAITLLFPLLAISAFSVRMVAAGTSYLYSFEIGAFRNEEANKLVGQGAILTIILSIFLGIIAFFGEEIFFSFYPDLGETEVFAREYYSFFFLLIALNPAYIFLKMTVYADGGGKIGVKATVVSFFVHLICSIIFGLKFGMAGIAFGTVLSYLAAIAVFLKWFFIDSQTLKPIFYFSLAETIRVFKYSYVHASLYLHIALGNMILNVFFLHMFNEKYFPILSVIVSILQFMIFLDGIGQAAEPLINIYLGENNYDGIKKVMNIAIKTALLFGAVTIPIIFIFSGNIAEVFGIKSEIFEETVFAIRLIAFSMPFISLLYLFATYFQIMSRFKIALALSFCKDFALYIVLPVILSILAGINGFWIGIMSVSMITCLIFIIFLRTSYRKSFPLLLPKKDIVSWDAKLNLTKVLELRDLVAEEFRIRGFEKKILMAVSLIIEEIGVSIVENNPNDEPLAEFTIIFDKQPQIIIRDNGLHFDLTDEKVVSFRSFFIYSYFEGSNIGRKYLTTQNYNRHIFTLLNE